MVSVLDFRSPVGDWRPSPCDRVVSLDTLSLSTQGPVVQKLDSAIHQINLYPVDNATSFPNTYPLDRDLSGG